MAIKKASTSDQLIKEIRRNTRKVYSAEEKILIVMKGIRDEILVTELCSKYGINDISYNKWKKELLKANKKHLQDDETR